MSSETTHSRTASSRADRTGCGGSYLHSRRVPQAFAAIAALVLVAGTVVGCTGNEPRSDAEASAAPSSSPTSSPNAAGEESENLNEAGLPGECTDWSAIRFAPTSENATSTTVSLEGPALVDTGERDLARGTVTLGDDGHPTSYTVVAGDAAGAIGTRFCVDYVTLLQFNHLGYNVDPGDVLVLVVDPSVPFPLDR